MPDGPIWLRHSTASTPSGTPSPQPLLSSPQIIASASRAAKDWRRGDATAASVAASAAASAALKRLARVDDSAAGGKPGGGGGKPAALAARSEARRSSRAIAAAREGDGAGRGDLSGESAAAAAYSKRRLGRLRRFQDDSLKAGFDTSVTRSSASAW